MNLPAVQIAPLRNAASRRAYEPATLMLWCTPILIAGAEWLSAVTRETYGIALYLLLLVALVLLGTLAQSKAARMLALALMLIPVQRVCVLALPRSSWPAIVQYIAIALPAFAGAWLVARQARLSSHALGLRVQAPALQLLFGACGPALGACLYYLLGSAAPSLGPTPLAWIYALFGSLVCVALANEILFRGVLQATALPVLRHKAVEYVALVYAATQVATLAPGYLIMMFCIGLTFGYVTRWSGSLLGVVVASILAHTTLLVVMPLIALDTNIIAATALTIVLLASALCGVLACVVLFYQAQAFELPWASEPALVSTPDDGLQTALPPTAATSGTSVDSGLPRSPADLRPLDRALARGLRAMRHEQQLTYFDLVTRTGLSMQVIASIEHGLIAPTNTELQLLAEALGTTSAALEAAARN